MSSGGGDRPWFEAHGRARDCDGCPERGEASGANDGSFCDELTGSELSERDLEIAFAAAFVFGLVADELGAGESVQ